MTREWRVRALDAFSRPIESDGPIYSAALASVGCTAVVEVGSGTGRLTAYLASQGIVGIGIEPDAEVRAASTDVLALRFPFHFVPDFKDPMVERALSSPRSALILPYNVLAYLTNDEAMAMLALASTHRCPLVLDCQDAPERTAAFARVVEGKDPPETFSESVVTVIGSASRVLVEWTQKVDPRDVWRFELNLRSFLAIDRLIRTGLGPMYRMDWRAVELDRSESFILIADSR